MGAFDNLRDRCAEAFAEPDFDAEYEVRLKIVPGLPASDYLLDVATTHAASSRRIGRSRRTIRAGEGVAIWEFENSTDAVEFALAFR